MNILEFRVFILLCLLAMIGISLLVFFVREKPIRKMMDLSFTYLLLITFIVYILVIKNFETILFPIFIIIFINFLLTLITGISIVNNLLINNKVKENNNIENDDWGYNYETLDDEDENETQSPEYTKIDYNEDEQNINKKIDGQSKNIDDQSKINNKQITDTNKDYNENDIDNNNIQIEEDIVNNEEDSEDDDDYNYKIFKDDESVNQNTEENNEDLENNDEEDVNDNNEDEDDSNIEDIDIEDLKKAFKNSNKDKVEIEEENHNFNFEEMVKNLDVHNEKNEEFDKDIDNDTEQKLKKIHKVADMIKDQKLNNKGGEDESN